MLEQTDNLFFTSDLHFHHRRVISFCERPFDDEKIMNAALINNWNSVCNPESTVFVLGDMFWFDSSREVKKIMKQLIFGKLYYIPGNHCSDHLLEQLKEWPNIEVMDSVVHLYLQNTSYSFVLTHYPLLTWPGRPQFKEAKRFSMYNLFGHVHTNPNLPNSDSNQPYAFDQMDIGCDSHNYYPYSYEQVVAQLEEQTKYNKYISAWKG